MRSPPRLGLVEEELAEARAADSPYAVASTLRTLAAVAPTDQRVDLLDEALGLLAGTGASRLEAQVRTDLAGWLMLLQPSGVRPRRRPAALGREVRAAGGPHARCSAASAGCSSGSARHPTASSPGAWASSAPPSAGSRSWSSLGKRNREIAVELGVSVKSVEWHVSHILRKLSITSRLELADALAQPRQNR